MTSGTSSGAEVRAPERALRSRAFARARNHSRRVRFFKLVIPVGAVLGIAGVVLATWFNPFRAVEGLTLGPTSVSGTKITMESPRLTGFRNDSRPYEVTASSAQQDVRKPHLVELKDLKARIVTDEQGSTARLEAVRGVLDTQKEQLRLRQDVRVRTDGGQSVRLRSAFVDFKAGTVVSNEPVTVSLGNGVITAPGLKVSDNGKVFEFKGRVSSTFAPSSSPAAANPPAPIPAGTAPAAPAAQPTSAQP